MKTHPFDTITLDNGAQLILTPCLGSKGASISSYLAVLKEGGTAMLLTLMFDKDMINNDITSLPQLCEENNITWLQLPIIDDGTPCEVFERQWDKYRQSIIALINKQGTITIHCKGGYGRTGLVAGLILRCHGLTAEQALKKLQKVKPRSLKNKRQLAYFNSF